MRFEILVVGSIKKVSYSRVRPFCHTRKITVLWPSYIASIVEWRARVSGCARSKFRNAIRMRLACCIDAGSINTPDITRSSFRGRLPTDNVMCGYKYSVQHELIAIQLTALNKVKLLACPNASKVNVATILNFLSTIW